MRFGVPPDSQAVETLRPQRSELISLASSKLLLAPEPRSAKDALQESLQSLEKLCIDQFNAAATARKAYLESISRDLRQQNKNFESLIDERVAKISLSEKAEIQSIMEDVRKAKEAEERRRKLEQEKLEQEEHERRRKALAEKEAQQKKEAEEHKRLEEQEKAKEAETKRKAELTKRLEELRKQAQLQKEQEALRMANQLPDKLATEQELMRYREDIKTIKSDVVIPMNENKDLKKQIGATRRKINVRLGQLSNSIRQLNTVAREVAELINALSLNALAYKWTLNYVAKAIVAQAEAEVTVKPTAALPLARLANILLSSVEGLEFYLNARFVKKCALVIGYTGSIDTEEGRVRMGWKRVDGKWESEVKYEERIGGILSVWAVMGREDSLDQRALFNIQSQWRTVARILNTPQNLLADVHYVVFANWWEASAQFFVKAYGKQAYKVLSVGANQWAHMGKQSSYPAATRLSVLGDDLKLGNYNSLKEMEA